jgi:hypothetical protein
MSHDHSTAVIEHYLIELEGDSPAELLGTVAERLLKALREARPREVRQLFALANPHVDWEFNDLARRLDIQPAAVELREGLVPVPASSASGLTPDGLRMLRRSAGCQRASGKRSTRCASRGWSRRNPPRCSASRS